jgi:hypothetical protein
MKNTRTRNPSVTPSHAVRIGSMVTLLAATGAVQTAHAGGIVRAWGLNVSGQCTVPTDLGPCTAVAAGGIHSLALRQDGGVRAWGDDYFGQCTVPPDLGACTAVAAGSDHSLAIAFDPLDRNNNGTLDSVEISNDPTLDHNHNGILDGWEIAQTPALDSNHNGVIDGVEITALTAQLECGDIDGYGEVGGSDLGLVLLNYGPCAQ